MAHDILVVDDETDIREMIAGILDDDGYGTRTAHDSDSALAAVKERKPSLVVLDIWLMGSRLDGLALLDLFRETDPDMPVVIISGHGNIETAVSAIKRGAYDYIEKPFKADRLLLVTMRALENSHLRREVRRRSEAVDAEPPARRDLRSAERPVADDSRTQERSRFVVGELLRKCVGVGLVDHRHLGEASVVVPPGEARGEAQVLLAAPAEPAAAARAA